MIDIKRIKEDPQKVIELFARKEKDAAEEIAKQKGITYPRM